MVGGTFNAKLYLEDGGDVLMTLVGRIKLKSPAVPEQAVTFHAGPSQPLQPMAPPEVAGRQFDYPIGYNLIVTPRGDEARSRYDCHGERKGISSGHDIGR